MTDFFDDQDDDQYDEHYGDRPPPLIQADKAAARGDFETAERWTKLAEQQCKLLERVVAAADKLGLIRDPFQDRGDMPSKREARRAAKANR